MVRILADHIISPLGFGTSENMNAVLDGKSGISLITNQNLSAEPFYGAALLPEQIKTLQEHFKSSNLTRLEQMMVFSVMQTVKNAGIQLNDPEVKVLIATTKGNIDLLANEVDSPDDSLLYRLSMKIGAYLGTFHEPLIISNACISGLLAIINGARLIESGAYKKIVVVGGDLLTRFTLAGFQSFHAVSPNPCKPYDEARDGITLGEAAGSLALAESDDDGLPALFAGASSNDANHISGPSRNGEGLFQALMRINDPDIGSPGMISAHGTATVFNDEMECQAFHRAGYADVPLHSLKGVYGHTLGAAGLIETIVGIKAMKSGVVLPSKGYENHGVSLPLNIAASARKTTSRVFLKTSSGFGGCNAAAMFRV